MVSATKYEAFSAVQLCISLSTPKREANMVTTLLEYNAKIYILGKNVVEEISITSIMENESSRRVLISFMVPVLLFANFTAMSKKLLDRIAIKLNLG